MNLHFRTGLLFFWGAVFVLLPLSLFAQTNDFRIVTSPLPVNVIAEPGTTVSTPLRIKNDGIASERLKIDVMKFSAFGDTGAPRLLDPEPGDTFLSWVKFPEREFSIAPGEWKTVTATFSIPQEAAFGYYYAVVFSRAGLPVKPKDGETGLSGGTAVLVLLEAKVPNAKREAAVEVFRVERKWYEFLPASFAVRVKNSGTVHIAPHGNIFVGREGEEHLSLLEVNSEKGNILPDSSREFTVSWKDGFPMYREKMENGKGVRDDQGQPVRELAWNWNDASSFRWGKYQAKLVLVYDDGKRDVPIEGVVDFWVFPWRMLTGGVAVTLFVLVGLWSTCANVWRKFLSRNGPQT